MTICWTREVNSIKGWCLLAVIGSFAAPSSSGMVAFSPPTLSNAASFPKLKIIHPS